MKRPHRLNLFSPFAPASKPQPRGARVLRRIGLTWRCAPLRRFVQVIFLFLYVYLFFYVAWPYAARFTQDLFADKEWIPAEVFLWIDPLVGLSTAIAARSWSVALLGMLGILLACLAFPRGFCGYVCPLGTLIDAWDWLIGKRVRRRHRPRRGPWVHLKYYLLAGVLLGSVGGVLFAGYVSAIPVLTRGMLFTAGRLQLGLLRNWHQVSHVSGTFYLSVALFLGVFLLSLFGRRFWCRYVCPSGALFSVANFFRLTERKVDASCTHCHRCMDVCPFDAIREDFTTRTNDCTFCQTCGGACPVHAIQFVSRWTEGDWRPFGDPPVQPSGVSRRGFLVGSTAGVAGALLWRRGEPVSLLRPPGSVSEDRFLDLCIRCGECFKVCPGPVLHPAGLQGGWEALWTPLVVPSYAGCHQDCNFCTQVCPTGAIRPLTLAEKRRTRIGLAVIDTRTCLPHTGERDCQLCFDECEAAGYHAIEMRPIQLDLGEIPDGVVSELELEAMSRIEAPFMRAEACIGCGLCEYRCHTTYVQQQHLLTKSAIVVEVVEPPAP